MRSSRVEWCCWGHRLRGQQPNLYLSYPQRNPLPTTADSLYLQLASGSTDPRSWRPTHYFPPRLWPNMLYSHSM
jgi:hypothetical protein